jgi:uncharacterized membrane protein YraQ (UPF0718 family)
MELLSKILNYVVESFLHIWPYLVITIPIAVAVQVSGASKFLTRIIGLNPIVAIFLATIVGAISPFCSCGVIPVIAALLIGGVPLAPVMSFWIASPSMDPEIFFLSASVVGMKMSVWRLVSTFVISLSAGLITHLAVKTGWLNSEDILAHRQQRADKPAMLDWKRITREVKRIFPWPKTALPLTSQLVVNESIIVTDCCVCTCKSSSPTEPVESDCCSSGKPCCSEQETILPFKKRLVTETWKAVFMTSKFMALAFLINALIIFCLPPDLFNGILANNGPFAVVIAALVGIPVYTSNMTALPLVSGLLALGMSPGAALAFLIAGPVTTLPAMSAVWGMVSRKVFLLYLLFPFAGAILFGWLYTLLN